MKQKQISKKQIAFIVLLIFWMVVIFCFSARNADLSTEDSNWVGMFIGSHFISGFRTWSAARQLAWAESIDHAVRKTAHATEYAVMAMIAFGAVGRSFSGLFGRSSASHPLMSRCIPAWVITTAYAATDELHQLFVPGRSCQFTDVCIDSCGAIAGLVLLTLIITLIVHIQKASEP